MKKILSILALILLIPSVALAAEYRSHDKAVVIGTDEVISNDLYVAAGTVTIDGTVNGDLIVAGGNVSINGKVEQDVIAAGGTVTINGMVGDDVRVAGGTVTIGGAIADDLLVGGGTVELTSKAIVNGDLKAGATQLTISGTVKSVEAGASDITVTSSAKISGDFNYWSDNDASISSTASISGKVNKTAVEKSKWEPTAGGIASMSVFSFITALIVLLLAVYYLPKAVRPLVDDWKAAWPTNLLAGFLWMVAAPIAVVILCATVVGLPLGLALLTLYIWSWYLAKLVAVVAIGLIVRKMWEKKAVGLDWLTVITGLIIFTVLGLIPILGWIVLAGTYFVGAGALVRVGFQALGKSQKNK